MSSQSYIHPDNAANEVAEDLQDAGVTPYRGDPSDPLRPVDPRPDDSLESADSADSPDSPDSPGSPASPPSPDEPYVDLDRPEDEGEPSSDDKYVNVVDGRPETLGFEADHGPTDADGNDVSDDVELARAEEAATLEDESR